MKKITEGEFLVELSNLISKKFSVNQKDLMFFLARSGEFDSLLSGLIDSVLYPDNSEE